MKREFENLKQALLEALAKKRKQSTDSSGEDCRVEEVMDIKHENSGLEPTTDWAIKPASPSSSEDLQEPDMNEDSSEFPKIVLGPRPQDSQRTKRKIYYNNDHDDEIRYFSNFIASKMKNYSETTKNAVQRDICEIIFKADQHYYETVVNDSNCTYVYDPLVEINTSKKPKI